jgi:hypothetical protein
MRLLAASASLALALAADAALAEAVIVDPSQVWEDVTVNASVTAMDGTTVQVSQTGGIWWSPSKTDPRVWDMNGSLTWTTSDGSSFTFSGANFDPDPVLFFSASATNSGLTPLLYSFTFSAPLIPTLSGAVNSYAELGITLTDGLNDGATVAVPTGNGHLLRSWDLIGPTLDPISKNVDVGEEFSIPAQGIYNPILGYYVHTGGMTSATSGSLICGVPCLTMAATLSFVLSPQDSAGFSGKIVQTLAPVPVPGALLLMGSGLLGWLGLGRRRYAAARA